MSDVAAALLCGFGGQPARTELPPLGGTGPGTVRKPVMCGNGDDWISMRGPAPVCDDNQCYRYHGNGVASGGNGDDRLFGSQGGQTLSGGPGDDRIDGGDGDDELNGDAGDDQLWGRKGNDTIQGDSGNDQLYGGLGRDRLAGGPGRDLTMAR